VALYFAFWRGTARRVQAEKNTKEVPRQKKLKTVQPLEGFIESKKFEIIM